MRRTSLATRAALVLSLALLAAACGDSTRDETGFDGTNLEIRGDVVSHETTRDILVFAPERDGSWPVVIAFHGIDGNAAHMAEFGRHLARNGYVVFSPTYRTDVTTQKGITQLVRDAECGYRYARAIAADYGGDLSRPVTFVGWSLGASLVLERAFSGDVTYPTGEPIACFEEAPRPDAVVAISGCHYESEGRETGLDMTGWTRGPDRVVLIAGQEDTNCAAWQSERAAQDMRAAGYDVELVMLRGTDHFAPIFLSDAGGAMSVVPDDPAGERTIGVVLDAIEGAGANP